MVDREFVAPTDEEYLRILGRTPEAGDEVGVAMLAMVSTDNFDVRLTTDVPGKSVRLVVARDGIEVFDVFREGAVLVSLSDEGPSIAVDFRTDGNLGRLNITLSPKLHIRETSLRT